MMEYSLLTDIMKVLWRRGCYRFDVLHSFTDSSGYDVVLEADGKMRHVQLKSSYEGSKTATQKINISLAEKPNGCVVWFFFDEETLEFTNILWFGSSYGGGIPALGDRVAKHSKANAQGVKKERKAMRVLAKGKFEKLTDIQELVDRLF